MRLAMLRRTSSGGGDSHEPVLHLLLPWHELNGRHNVWLSQKLTFREAVASTRPNFCDFKTVSRFFDQFYHEK
jgi:hypothetical protein